MAESYSLAELEPDLQPLQLRRLLRLVGLKDLGDLHETQVSAGQALLVWTSTLLRRRRPLQEEQIEALLEELAGELVAVGDKLEIAVSEQQLVPLYQLVIADGTLVGLTGKEKWLDLHNGGWLPEPRQQPIEAVAYSLTALYLFQTRRVQENKQRPRQGVPDDHPARR